MTTGQGSKRLWELKWTRFKINGALDVKLSSDVVT